MPEVAPRAERASPTLTLLGSRFTNVSRTDACHRILDLARRERFHVIGFKDVALMMRALDDPWLKDYYERVDELFVDGRGLVLAARLLGERFIEMVSAPFSYKEVLGLAESRGMSVYIVGAAPDVLPRALAAIAACHPRLRIAGSHHGYFDEAKAHLIAEAIRASNADIVILGMGTPHRERFTERWLRALPRGVSMPVGGVLDVEAGLTRLAPGFIRALGLEWLYRVLQEPWRLGPRYLRTHPRFVWAVLREAVRRRIGGIPEHAS